MKWKFITISQTGSGSKRGIWFRLCDGSDFFKNDYRTTRYGPHDLHSFGRGYRLISEKNDLHL